MGTLRTRGRSGCSRPNGRVVAQRVYHHDMMHTGTADAGTHNHRPTGVELLSVCYMLVGLLMVTLSITSAFAMPNVHHGSFRGASAFLVSAVAFLGAAGIASILIAVGLFRGAKIAWIAALAVSILYFAAAVGRAIGVIRNVPFGTVIPAAEGSTIVTALGHEVVTAVIAAFVLRYLLRNDVRAYCAVRIAA
jgi:lysylphosphatidylglycerol synthetase-like protein (DUF2156 family)